MAGQADETSLIQKYLAPLAAAGGLGLKDDAAVLTPSAGCDLVLTADAIVEGTHFLPGDDPSSIAAKAIAVNLSDLTAKGASLLGYLVTLVLPAPPPESWMEAFASGLSARAHGRILGGDMTVGGNVLSISVTAIGEVPHGRMVLRSGAKPGDVLFVAGPIGSKAAGLRAATDRNWLEGSGLDEKQASLLVSEYAAPQVPFADIHARIIRDNASAAMDISDGLILDLERLCTASGVGARLAAESVPLAGPVAQLVKSGKFTLEEAFTGGDDYVALFTVPPGKAEKMETAGGIARCYRIGEILSVSNGVAVLDRTGNRMQFGAIHGYDHFKSNN